MNFKCEEKGDFILLKNLNIKLDKFNKKKHEFSLGLSVSPEFAVDLGSVNTVIHMKDKGIVLREPSMIALDMRTEEVIAVGQDAKDMMGKSTKKIKIIRPIQGSVIADVDVAVIMLKAFMKKVQVQKTLAKAKLILSYPSGATEVEKSALFDVGVRAGGGEVNIVEASIATIIGQGYKLTSSRAQMVVNIGAGHIDSAVCSFGEIISSSFERIGGEIIDRDIARYVKARYKLIISEQVAENVKIKIGSAFPNDEDYQNFMDIHGRGLYDNMPKSITISAEEVRNCICLSLGEFSIVLNDTFAKIPAQVAVDILENGIILTGGTAMLKGIDEYITEKTGLEVRISKKPMDVIVEGLGMMYNAEKIEV